MKEKDKKKSRRAGNLHISLPEDKALELLLKVKPTDEMPRRGSAKKKKKEED